MKRQPAQSEEMQVFIGIDYHKTESVYSVLDVQGDSLGQGVLQVAAQHWFAAARAQGAAFDYHSPVFEQECGVLRLVAEHGLILYPKRLPDEGAKAVCLRLNHLGRHEAIRRGGAARESPTLAAEVPTRGMANLRRRRESGNDIRRGMETTPNTPTLCQV